MNKSLISGIKCIINDIEGYDYISKVKYVILLVCKELYNMNNKRTLETAAIFKEYAKFDLEASKTGERIPRLMNENADNIEVSSFYPAFYMKHCLQTRKEISRAGVHSL